MDRLSEHEIEAGLAALTDWRRAGRALRPGGIDGAGAADGAAGADGANGAEHGGREIMRRYGFVSFLDAVEFVNRVAALAEERRHHPFISIDYRHVTLRLTTWSAGGLTALDFALARQFDDLFEAERAGGGAP